MTPYNTNAFGATYLADQSTYDSETQKGVLKFDGDVTKVGDSAFSGCRKLTSLTLPNSVQSIGLRAFIYCESLKEFKGKFASDNGRCLINSGEILAYAEASGSEYIIPQDVSKIGQGAFSYCYSLTKVTISNAVTEIGYEAFECCFGLTEIIIPNTVTSIGDQAFNYCKGLKSVIVGNGVETISDWAFKDCYALSNVLLGEQVKTLGEEAFSSCSSLATIIIPSSVSVIGARAFQSCSNLTGVYCKSSIPPYLNSFAFDNNGNNRKIYVPISDDDSVINAYRNSNVWRNYTDDIVEYDFSAE